ncbi:GcrA family cell cycle regulator [Chelativorans xinjiangense]|uniref:GcrA family cell cycle regulator n=1 Tax=Chelativorans xinjiangense TaxID=2681485 RepID=UPI001358D845|nr:GcrA family cell cycle regulator [Chelativorans xinjiangense]
MNIHVFLHWKDLDTPGKIDAIKAVHEHGMSARKIAQEIPGASRNSIIGMYHRHANKLVGFALPSGPGTITTKKRKGAQAEAIISFIEANPKATASEIAKHVRTNHSYVHTVAKANGHIIPRGDVGGYRPRVGKPGARLANLQDIEGRRDYGTTALDFRVRKPNRPAWRDLPIPDDAPPPRMVSLLDLEPNECKWPYGDPREADFGFCAHERAPGSPYCRYHAACSSGSFHCEEQAA